MQFLNVIYSLLRLAYHFLLGGGGEINPRGGGTGGGARLASVELLFDVIGGNKSGGNTIGGNVLGAIVTLTPAPGFFTAFSNRFLAFSIRLVKFDILRVNGPLEKTV